jgi:hypothetical protein
MVQERGFQQAHGEEKTIVVFKTSFQTIERNSTIRLTINDDPLVANYHFSFEEVKDGEPVETTKTFFAVSCVVERYEDGSEGSLQVADATLTIAMSQTQIREGTQDISQTQMTKVASAPVAFQSLSVTILAIIMLIIILNLVNKRMS